MLNKAAKQTILALGLVLGLIASLTLPLAMLKYVGYFTCPWWIVFIPIISPLVLFFAIGIMTIVVFFIVKTIEIFVYLCDKLKL